MPSFLRRLYEHGIDAGYYGFICAAGDWDGLWGPIGDLAEYAERHIDSDLYIAGGMIRAGSRRRGRARAGDIGCVCGLWLDVDIAGDGKTKPYPQDKAEIDDALRLCPMPKPSVVVSTGGGYHYWYLLDEPWIIESEQDRKIISNAERAVVVSLRTALARKGKTLDSVHDLSRVMRLPGTRNCKYDPPREVRIVDEGPSYALDEIIEPGLADDILASGDTEIANLPVADYTQTPEPIVDAMRALCTQDSQFRSVYMRTAHDDWSDSEYDLAIASVLVGFGLSDPEIAYAICHSRRVAGRAQKVRSNGDLRLDYIARTIGKARQDKPTPQGGEPIAVVDVDDNAKGETPNGTPDKASLDRDAAIAMLSKMVGMPVVRVLRTPPKGWDEKCLSLVRFFIIAETSAGVLPFEACSMQDLSLASSAPNKCVSTVGRKISDSACAYHMEGRNIGVFPVFRPSKRAIGVFPAVILAASEYATEGEMSMLFRALRSLGEFAHSVDVLRSLLESAQAVVDDHIRRGMSIGDRRASLMLAPSSGVVVAPSGVYVERRTLQRAVRAIFQDSDTTASDFEHRFRFVDRAFPAITQDREFLASACASIVDSRNQQWFWIGADELPSSVREIYDSIIDKYQDSQGDSTE